MNSNREAFQKLEALYQDNAIRDRKYYPDFRRSWNALLEPASENEEEYFPLDSDSVVVIRCDYGGLDFDFHFDQAKMADWYYQEVKRGKRVVFVPKRFKRSRSGQLSFHESACFSHPEFPETSLPESDRNIMACAMPGLPPELHIVYGNKWIEKPSLTSDKDIFEYTYDHFCNQVMFSGEAIDNAKPVCNYIMSVYATGCTTIMESLAAQLYVNNLSEAIQAEINPRLFNEIALDTDNIDRAIKDISDTLVGTEIYQADDDNNGFENYAGDNDATETYAEKCNKVLNKSRTIIVNKGKSNYNTQSGMSSRAVSSLEKPDFDFYGNNCDEMIKLVKNSFNWQIAECQLDFDTVKDIAAYAKSNKMSIRTLLSKAGYDVSGIAKNANLVSSKAWTDKKNRLLKVWCWAYYKGFNVDEVGAEEKTTEFWTLGDGITGKWNSPKGNEVCIFNG